MSGWDIEKVTRRKWETHDEIASFILPEKIKKFNELMAQYLILEWWTCAYNWGDAGMMEAIEKMFWREKVLKK